MSDKMSSTKKALYRYIEKSTPKKSRTKKRNAKPEKQVEKQVLTYLNKNGFSVHVIESKAVFNKAAGRYLKGQTDPGMTDIIGCTPKGIAVFVELKAAGKRSTLAEHQRDFLINKINMGCFACVVDGVDSVKSHWDWFSKGNNLIEMLPKAKRQKSNLGSDSSDDLPF